MSAWPTFALYIDSDDRGNFTSGEDVAARVIEAEAFLGFTDPTQRVAAPCKLTVLVDNSTQIFDAEADATVRMSRRVQLTATYNAATSVLWTGLIDHVEASEEGTTARLYCSGVWRDADGTVDVGIYATATADEVILDMIEQAQLRQAQTQNASPGLFLVGVVGHAELGTNTNLADNLPYLGALETGVTTLTYVGRAFQKPTARQVIEAVTRAEWGYFYEDAQGTLNFLNRQHVPLHYTPDLSLGGGDLVLDGYSYGAPVINEITLDLVSYVVTDNVAAWTSIAPIKFLPGYSQRRIHFRTADGRAYNVVSDPVPTNMVFKTAQTGGTTVTPSLAVTTLSDGVLLSVQNDRSVPIYLQIGAVMTASVLTEEVPEHQVISNYQSRSQYGRHPLPFALPRFSSVENGVSLAQYIVGTYGDPAGKLRTIRLRNDTAAHVQAQIGLGLFGLVNVTLDNLNHDANYVICGIKHVIKPEAYTTELWLDRYYPVWILGNSRYSILGQTTRLGY